MDIANPLALWRARMGYSFQDAAKVLGLDKAQYWRIEMGEKRGDDETEHRVVAVTGVTRDQLACIRQNSAIRRGKRRGRLGVPA